MKKYLVVLGLGMVLLPAIVVAQEGEVDGLREQRAKVLMERREERLEERVARLAARLGELNRKRMAVMNRHLGRMRALMEKVRAARDRAVARGRDVTEVNAAIAAADAAIAAAQTAVDIQEAKTYPATTRVELLAAKQNLLRDLRSVHEKLKEARKAVAGAVSALAKVRGEVAPTAAP